MALITLHTPRHMSDNRTTTEFETNDIIHIVSIVGNDDSTGTTFYLHGIPGKQTCLEPAKEVKRLVAANKDKPQQPPPQLHIHGDNSGVVVQTAGNSNTVVAKQITTVNQQFNETIEKLCAAVNSSDLEDIDKDEIVHNLGRVKKLAGDDTPKAKLAALDKLTAIAQIVAASAALATASTPLIMALRAWFS